MRSLLLGLAVVAAIILLGASPGPGRQNQVMVPALVLARLRLYGKVAVLY
jgi:hypothetical protein